MRKKLIAGNWKMNLGWNEALTLVADLSRLEHSSDWDGVDVMIFPPSIYARPSIEFLKNARSKISVGLQDCASTENGAFTGEISAEMIREIGAESVIIGHSERRLYFNEGGDQLLQKLSKAIDAGIKPILCCGESLEDRKAGRQEMVVKQQLAETLFRLKGTAAKSVTIAYEPVWAIGTGETATPAQAQEMHFFIRGAISSVWDQEMADQVRILYGGSMNPKNASELLAQDDVDGGLIGGASLKAADFQAVIES